MVVALCCRVMRWLALDVGTRRVGVAVSDSAERVVTPVEAVAFAPPERLAEEVLELVERWEAEAVVVGIPVTRSGHSRGERRVAEVVGALRATLHVPVETCDERGSTQLANAWLDEARVPKNRRAGRVDSLAAKAILERLLAQRSRTAGGQEGRVDQKTREW
jgi:putative Holliday junction resolvase